MLVFYKLNDKEVGRIEVKDGGDVQDLKTALVTGKKALATLDEEDLRIFSPENETLVLTDQLKNHESFPDKPLLVKADIPSAIPAHFAPILLNLALQGIEVGWEKISSERTSVESTTARQNSVEYYGLTGKKHCQILGAGMTHVQNAHIWPHNNMRNLPLVDLEATDIDNAKNVLRLHDDIENKFDRFHLTFVQSGADFVLELLDPNIKDTVIKDTTLTFGDIHGKKLECPSGRKPWKRLLDTHSILAHRHARKNGWLDEEELTAAESSATELMEFSLDRDAQARIKMLLNK